jgi:hypothetical protein
MLSIRRRGIISLDITRQRGTRATTRPTIAGTAMPAPGVLERPAIERALTMLLVMPREGMQQAAVPAHEGAEAAEREGGEAAGRTMLLPEATRLAITPATTIPDGQGKSGGSYTISPS